MTSDDIIRIAREAGFCDAQQIELNVEWTCVLSELQKFAALIIQHKALDQLTAVGQYEQGFEDGAAAEREECAKVCHDKAWELKERSMKETVKTQRVRLASEAAGWHDAFTAIRARGQQ